MAIVMHDKDCSIFGEHRPRKCDCGADESQFIKNWKPELTIFPVPIRPDVIVRLELPHDLTKKEAEQICRVVMAFAVT